MNDARFTELRDTVVPVLRPFGLKRLAVFGSYARGEESSFSDIDLLVTFSPRGERPPIGLKWFTLEQRLTEMLGHPVEMVSEEALSPHIKPSVDREKVLLYEG